MQIALERALTRDSESTARRPRQARTCYPCNVPAPKDVEPTWIPAEKNRFHLRIMDCRPFTQGAISMTKDLNVAKRFGELRHSDGRNRRGRKPEHPVTIPANLTYHRLTELHEGILYRATDMAEKWDADFFDGRIYFSRSWTGDLALVADVTMQSRVLAISAVTRSSIAAEPSPMPVRDVDFLVKTYILRGEVPHCLPPELPNLESAIATYSFSIFGRAAAFASYGDTTEFVLDDSKKEF